MFSSYFWRANARPAPKHKHWSFRISIPFCNYLPRNLVSVMRNKLHVWGAQDISSCNTECSVHRLCSWRIVPVKEAAHCSCVRRSLIAKSIACDCSVGLRSVSLRCKHLSAVAVRHDTLYNTANSWLSVLIAFVFPFVCICEAFYPP